MLCSSSNWSGSLVVKWFLRQDFPRKYLLPNKRKFAKLVFCFKNCHRTVEEFPSLNGTSKVRTFWEAHIIWNKSSSWFWRLLCKTADLSKPRGRFFLTYWQSSKWDTKDIRPGFGRYQVQYLFLWTLDTETSWPTLQMGSVGSANFRFFLENSMRQKNWHRKLGWHKY